jgi:uncharacterized protein (TIGR02270 family)
MSSPAPTLTTATAVARFVPAMIDQHSENAASLWLIRDNAVRASSFRLADLVKLDERIEANIDGLRIAATRGWSFSLDELDRGGAGEFFIAGILSVESENPSGLDQIIDRAYARAAMTMDEPYHPAADPWRGLVSALAWAHQAPTVSAVGRLLDTPRPRTRWLAVAACGARRMVRQQGLEAALADPEALVRARAARTIGELGRIDLRKELNAALADPDEDCRFWAAWSATRLGTTEGRTVLAEFASLPGPKSNPALDLLLRCISTEEAKALLRPLARDPARRRTVIRAAGIVGDALYIPWLIGQISDPPVARTAGDALASITGVDIATLSRAALPDFQLGPSDDPDDENVSMDEDEGFALPDAERLGQWWDANKAQFIQGTAYFLGTPKSSANWFDALAEAAQRRRWPAALELAVLQPNQAMLEVRARGRLQQQLLARARSAP